MFSHAWYFLLFTFQQNSFCCCVYLFYFNFSFSVHTTAENSIRISGIFPKRLYTQLPFQIFSLHRLHTLPNYQLFIMWFPNNCAQSLVRNFYIFYFGFKNCFTRIANFNGNSLKFWFKKCDSVFFLLFLETVDSCEHKFQTKWYNIYTFGYFDNIYLSVANSSFVCFFSFSCNPKPKFGSVRLCYTTLVRIIKKQTGQMMQALDDENNKKLFQRPEL